MAKETTLFERFTNVFNKRADARHAQFKAEIAGALGDAAPEDAADDAGIVAGVQSLRAQATERGDKVAELEAELAPFREFVNAAEAEAEAQTETTSEAGDGEAGGGEPEVEAEAADA